MTQYGRAGGEEEDFVASRPITARESPDNRYPYPFGATNPRDTVARVGCGAAGVDTRLIGRRIRDVPHTGAHTVLVLGVH